MRYYHPFPEAIPLSEAGCSRVTHPSATMIPSKLRITVRLACVRRAASVRPEPGSNSLLNSISYSLPGLWNQSCSITLALLLRIFYSLLEFLLPISQKNFKGRYFSFSIVQFSRCCQSLTDLFIISHLFLFVKYFLKFFSNFFPNFFQMQPLVLRQLNHYITYFYICQAFFKTFFQKFLRYFCFRSRPTALLLYHTFSLLSSKLSVLILLDF